MHGFDYPYLIGKLTTEGFRHCRQLLFPMLSFHYMTEEKLRTIDICERMHDISQHRRSDAGRQNAFSVETYCDYLNSAIQSSMTCKVGSIAADYKNLAATISKGVIDGDLVKYEKLFTLFAVYVGLSREIYPDYSKKEAEEAHLTVDKSDAELLISLRDSRQKKMVTVFNKKQVEQEQSLRELICLHNIILYSVMMELQGAYSEEER